MTPRLLAALLLVCSVSLSARNGYAQTLGINPGAGIQLSTIFFVDGQGYTPNGAVHRFIFQPAWGEYRQISSITADASGRFSWTYMPDCTHSTGTTFMYVRDAATGRRSGTTTFVVQPHGTCSAQTLGISPSTGAQLSTNFVVTGGGYTANSVVWRFINQPGWGGFRQISSIQAGSGGQISWNYVPDCTHPPGTTTMYVQDGASGRSSPTVAFNVTANAGCSPAPAPPPTLSISPSSGSQLTTTFSVTGTGYQPNGIVNRFVNQPAWGGYRVISTIRANASGQIAWTYVPDCTHSTGATFMYVVDEQTGAQSNTVTFAVQPAQSCQSPALSITNFTPAQAPRGQATTFTVTGTGFDPAFTAELIVDGNTWPIPAVHFTSPTSIRITPFIGGGTTANAELRISSGGQQASFSFLAVAGGDHATFVDDIGLQDGATVTAGAPFTKTWRLRNAGGTTWGPGYALTFADRHRLGAPLSVNVGTTAPGATVDVSVSMTAPAQPGTYQGYWRMKNPAGAWFGDQVFVLIVVPPAAGAPPPSRKILTAATHGFRFWSEMQQEIVDLGTRIDGAIAARGQSSNALGSTFAFNWSEQSNNDGFGWATAAGDWLFAELAQRLNGHDAAVHLIGYSLGGTVVDQAALRLLQYGYDVEQVTFLEGVSSKSRWSNPGIRAWDGIRRIDNYIGSGCFRALGLFDYMPVGPVAPAGSAHEVVLPDRDHSGGCPQYQGGSIVNYYLNTINASPSPNEREGWYWSPLAEGGTASFPDVSSPPAREKDAPPTETVLNGAFTMRSASESRNVPGYEWTDGVSKVHGMQFGTQLVRRDRDDFAAVLTRDRIGGPSPRLRHAPLYIQGNPNRPRFVDTLRFEYLLSGLHGSDQLVVSLGDVQLTACRPDIEDGEWHFIECALPPEVLNRAVVLEFDFRLGATSVFGQAWIDNITLEKSGGARVRYDTALQHIATTPQNASAAITSAPSVAAPSLSASSRSESPATVAAAALDWAPTIVERDVVVTIENSAYAVWNVSADANWVAISPAVLTGSGGTVRVTMDISNLAPGNHVAGIRVVPAGWAGAPDVGTTIPVVAIVAAPETREAVDNGPTLFDAGVSVRFQRVDVPGQVTVSRSSVNTFALPQGLALPADAVGYRVAATAAFSGPAILGFPFDARSLDEDARPAVVRIEGDTIVDVTSGVDLQNGIVYATSTSLGDFVVVSDTRARAQFMAEGATGGLFDELIALANPHDAAADVLVTFLQLAGPPVTRTLTLPARSHHTIDVRRDIAELTSDASIVVQPLNGLEVVSERTMTWSQTNPYGGHSGSGQTMPSVRWYFAEGATSGPFDLWILLANPNQVEARVRVTFLREDSTTIEQHYVVPARARVTIAVDAIPGLESAGVSSLVESTNGVAVYAERSMYWSSDGLLWRGGHASPGVPRLSPRWMLAEGATGSFFDLYLLLANPNQSTVPAQVTFLKMDGTTVTRRFNLPPTSRTTISVDGIPGLEDTGVSMVVETENGAGVVAERAMYWGDPSHNWIEGHSSPGVIETGSRWAIAGGEVGRHEGATYILIANPSAEAAHVRVIFLRENGRAPVVKEFTVPPASRFNVAVLTGGSAEVPEIVDERFGAIVESLNGVGIVVEQARYWNANGRQWEGGTNGTAQRLKK